MSDQFRNGLIVVGARPSYPVAAAGLEDGNERANQPARTRVQSLFIFPPFDCDR
jgi:hypothetical protein